MRALFRLLVLDTKQTIYPNGKVLFFVKKMINRIHLKKTSVFDRCN